MAFSFHFPGSPKFFRDLLSAVRWQGGFIRQDDDTESWDDLRFPVSGLSPPGPVNAPTIDPETGLAIFENAKTNLTAGIAQMPHAWVQGTAVQPHVHWIQTTADDVLWQLEYKIMAAVGGTIPAAWTTVPSAHKVADFAGVPMPQITSFGEIDMTGYDISSMILFRLSRLGADALDTSAVDVSLLEFDIHYRVNSFGSQELFTKS